MKILVVTTWLPTADRPETGVFVARDIEMLRADHEVDVIHLTEARQETHVDFPVVTVPMSQMSPRSITRAAHVIREHAARADLVHTMAASTLLPFRALRLGRPWVHTEHWSGVLSSKNLPLVVRTALPLTRRLLARPSVVIAVGRDLCAAIEKYRPGPTLVIPNEVFRPAELRERPQRASIVLVGVGGMVAGKGPDIALRALADLVSRGLDARLVWAGDGPMRTELAQLAESLGVADRWDPRGRVAPALIPDLVAEGDLFLLPTQSETFGVAIAEALMSGRPVVVGANGEHSSFVGEPDGVLVSEQTGSAYAEGVQRALVLNQNRTASEIAARATELFDPEERRRMTAEAYAVAVASPDGRAPVADVEVVIAAHDVRRPVGRAVVSALSSATVARVLVVCHGVGVDEMAARLGAIASDDRVSLIPFKDGVRSPAGPFNAGIERCVQKYISVLGSDDELSPGAIDAWRRTAARSGADVVIAPLRHAGGTRVPTPPTLRRQALQGVRDRLAYRTAPLGLYARSRFGGLRFTPGLATGEDLAFTTRLWFSGATIVRHVGPGEYVIHDGEERVTFMARTIAEDLRAVDLLLSDGPTLALSRDQRLALATKLWRISIFGAVHYRAGNWSAADREALARLVRKLRMFAPAAPDVLSRADAALVAALADPTTEDADVDELSRRRRRFLSLAALLPARGRRLFAREAPLRFGFATWWSLRF